MIATPGTVSAIGFGRQMVPPTSYRLARDIDAKLQSQAIALGGGDINYLTPEEGAKADTVNLAVLDRVWNLWKLRVAPTLAK
jgi:hypothetical protein